MKESLLSLLALSLISAPLISGCGKTGIGGLVSSAQFRTLEESGEILGDLTLLLKTGNVRLPAFELPIYDSHSGARPIGTIGMRDALSAGTQLQVRVNLEAIRGLNAADGSVLPNGRPIPVVLASGTSAVSVPLRENSRLYFAFSDSQALIGTALVIPEFDNLSSAVGAIDVFFPFQDASGARGVAGLFSSERRGESGIAVFVDVGSALNSETNPDSGSVGPASKTTPASGAMEFSSGDSLSKRRAYRLNQFMNRLSLDGHRLGLK